MHTLTYKFRLFAHEHDDIPAFHAAYLVGTFLVAAIFSLGYFALLILLHMMLDFVKYRDYFHYSIPMTLKAMFLESVVDLAFFFVSLTFGVYLSHDLALSLASGVFRSSLTILEAFGTILPKIYILEHLMVIAVSVQQYLYSPHVDLKLPLLKSHRIALLTIGICLLLLLASVPFYAARGADLAEVFARELTLKL